jgi:hypothetical protein
VSTLANGYAYPTPSPTSTSTSSSDFVPPSDPLPQTQEAKASNAGAIAGGVVGGLAAVAVILAIIWWLKRRNQKQGAESAAATTVGPALPHGSNYGNYGNQMAHQNYSNYAPSQARQPLPPAPYVPTGVGAYASAAAGLDSAAGAGTFAATSPQMGQHTSQTNAFVSTSAESPYTSRKLYTPTPTDLSHPTNSSNPSTSSHSSPTHGQFHVQAPAARHDLPLPPTGRNSIGTGQSILGDGDVPPRYSGPIAV